MLHVGLLLAWLALIFMSVQSPTWLCLSSLAHWRIFEVPCSSSSTIQAISIVSRSGYSLVYARDAQFEHALMLAALSVTKLGMKSDWLLCFWEYENGSFVLSYLECFPHAVFLAHLHVLSSPISPRPFLLSPISLQRYYLAEIPTRNSP